MVRNTIRPFGAGANSLIQQSLSGDQAAQQLEANSFVRYLPDPQNAIEDTQVVCIDSETPGVAYVAAIFEYW